jgi:hypothetical protein
MGHDFEEQTQKRLLNGAENDPTQIAMNGVAPQSSISFASQAPVIMANLPTENTPLLSTPIPRIDSEEGVPHCLNGVDGLSTWVMFQEELGVLTKYTLPIYTFVQIAASNVTFTNHRTSQNSPV